LGRGESPFAHATREHDAKWDGSHTNQSRHDYSLSPSSALSRADPTARKLARNAVPDSSTSDVDLADTMKPPQAAGQRFPLHVACRRDVRFHQRAKERGPVS